MEELDTFLQKANYGKAAQTRNSQDRQRVVEK
jgi:hypothetical protein